MRKRQHSFLCWPSCAVLAAASSNRVYLSFLFLKCRARVRLAVMSSFSPPPAAEMSLLPLSSSLPKYFISVSFGDFVPIILAANTPSQPSPGQIHFLYLSNLHLGTSFTLFHDSDPRQAYFVTASSFWAKLAARLDKTIMIYLEAVHK